MFIELTFLELVYKSIKTTKLKIMKTENINLKEINFNYVKGSDKWLRMFSGASNSLEKLDKEEIIIQTVLDIRFFSHFPRSIEAYCYQVANSASGYLPFLPPVYKVAIFMSDGVSGFVLNSIGKEVIYSDHTKILLNELKKFTSGNSKFLDVIQGRFENPIEEESQTSYNNKFPIHPALLPWTERIGFKL